MTSKDKKHCCHEWTLLPKDIQPWICGCDEEFFGSLEAKYKCEHCGEQKIISYKIDK